MKYLLDTDHCSYIQRRHPEVLRRFQTLPPSAEVVTSVVTQAELLMGIRGAPSPRRREQLESLYEQILANIADILPITSQVAERFAEIANDLAKKGRPIPVNDIWIAAIALANDLILVTNDAHFEYIEDLQVEDWTKGEE